MNDAYDLFVLRDSEGPILYAPLNEAIARLNDAGIAAVRRYLAGAELTEDEYVVIEQLKPHRFFDAAKPPPEPENDFSPTHVTLFPSDGCNLRCSYCYAAAERPRHIMPYEIGCAAIDFVVENVLAKKQDSFELSYHGNGEPFTAFDRIKAFNAYAQDKADEHQLTCRISVATNGALNEEQLDCLIAQFDSANISFDGLPELQNRQRPFADGSGSFEYVDRTLKRMQDAGKMFGIRATLTGESIRYLEQIAAYVAENYPRCSQLHIEPAWECGRCLTTGEQTPDVDEFIERFTRAVDMQPDGAPALVYSAARHGFLTTSFCAVSKGGFTVTSEGYATACYEICSPEDDRFDAFVYGKYDPEQKRFVFDREKLKRLAVLQVENMPFCKDCFCKWHCAGDCPAKLLGTMDPREHRGSARCKIARALTLQQITRKLKTSERVFEDTMTEIREEQQHEQRPYSAG